MKRFRWLGVAILFIIASSLLPLSFTLAAQADSGKGNLKEITDGADSILIGTVTERSSYWNDEHTRIYTSVVFSVEDRIKGEAGPDKVTITVPGGEVEGIGEFVSEMPSFDQGEKAVVFLKKLNKTQPPKAMSLPDKFPAQQFEVYAGFRGKFPIKGDKIDSLPVAEFKGRVNKIVGGQALPATELDISPSLVTMPYLYAGYSWPHPPAPVVPYRINENASSCTGEGAAVQNAAPTWAAAGVNFSFSYAGTTAVTTYGYDGVNEIMWVNMGGTNILAVTHIWYSGSTILENDVEFNNYYNWSTSPTCPGGYYDVQSVGLHEFGHWLCLSDLYDPADAAKVMYGYASSGTTKRALTADDIAGIQSIYGASASSEPNKLIGADDASGSNEGAGVTYTRFQAVASGLVSQFRVKASVNSQVKVAIYSDNGGSPGNRLVNNDTAQNVSLGWNTLSIPSLTVTNGTYYWLAVAIKDPGASQFISGGTMQWQVGTTFSSFGFPATPGSGLYGGSYTELVAGWQATGPVPLSITTSSLPDGTVGIPYSQQLQATGGTGSYTWSISLGSLPAGLTLTPSTGVISGTPTTTGTSNFTVQVSDGSTIATKSLSIMVTSGGGTQKLVGADDASGINDGAGVTYTRFQAVASGLVSQFRVKAGINSQVKVAIYSDSSGLPGNRLVNNDTAQNVSPGWNTLSIPASTVTNGTYYWLAVAIKDPGASQFISGGTMQWQVGTTFSSFAFPVTPGSGLYGGSYTELLAGWATPSLPPDAAPILTSPGAVITFKWGAADRATTYWLQVNTQSDFSGTNLFNAEVGNVTTQEVTGLSLGITYYCRVKAGNASGWGPWSSVRSVLANTMP